MDNRQIVSQYIPYVKFLAGVCGPRYEIVLHCFDDFEHSIVAIENGYITGRKVNDGLLNLALDMIFDDKLTENNDFLTNIRGHELPSGRKVRLSTFYIRDSNRKIIGIIGVNEDITDLVNLYSFSKKELFFGVDDNHPVKLINGDEFSENFETSAFDMIKNICQKTIEQMGFSKSEHLNKEGRMKVIDSLNRMNLFKIKGAVRIAAKQLSISEPSVYRYLKEIDSF